MKKNDVFTFTAPNGVEVTAVIIDCLGTCNFEEVEDSKHWDEKYLCYAQNRLFYHIEWTQIDKVIDDDFVPSCDEEDDWYYAIRYHSHEVKSTGYSQKTLVDYCTLPDYDDMLEDYFQQHEESVKIVQGFGYTRAEASNILEGKNADGSDFEKLPF